jgi:hypothetical protein
MRPCGPRSSDTTGGGDRAPMHGLDEPGELARKRFYQAHYSFALKMHAIESCSRRVDQTNGLAADYESFEQEMDRLFHLMACVGYVHDMFKTIDDALSAGGVLRGPLRGGGRSMPSATTFCMARVCP